MKCKVCNADTELNFTHKVLHKYDIKYYFCPNCSFMFTENPYWLEEAYNNPINLSDTGILDRNLYFRKVVSSIIFLLFDRNKLFLDYAGGYGIFTRLMRDIGFDFYWEDKYTKNILARGFEFSTAHNKTVELLTAFEVFEHFANPVEEIKQMLKITTNITFSTILLPIPAPDPEDWWYYSFNHGQHLAFYSEKTLNYIAENNSLNFYTCGDIHLFTKEKINPFLFSLIVKFAKYGLGFVISLLMKGKVWEDHLYLENKF